MWRNLDGHAPDTKRGPDLAALFPCLGSSVCLGDNPLLIMTLYMLRVSKTQQAIRSAVKPFTCRDVCDRVTSPVVVTFVHCTGTIQTVYTTHARCLCKFCRRQNRN